MKWLGLAVALLLTFAAGSLCAVLVQWYGVIDLKKEITVGNVVQAAATMFTGVVVAMVIQRFVATNRKEKDILLSYMEQLIDDIGNFEATIGKGVLTEMVAALKKCSMRSNALKGVLEELKYPASIREGSNFIKELFEINTLATETPIHPAVGDNIQGAEVNAVADGIVTIPSKRRALLDAQLQALKIRIQTMQLRLNRA